MINRGKQFEDIFRQDISKLEGVSCLRLPDQWTGYTNSSNPCDFIVYKYPTLLYVELKSRYKNTFNLKDFSQYEYLKSISSVRGLHPVVIIWFIDHDKVVCFPIKEVERMRKDGLKSINVKDLKKYEGNYSFLEIPSIKKRIFMESDYGIIFKTFQEEDLLNG